MTRIDKTRQQQRIAGAGRYSGIAGCGGYDIFRLQPRKEFGFIDTAGVTEMPCSPAAQHRLQAVPVVPNLLAKWSLTERSAMTVGVQLKIHSFSCQLGNFVRPQKL